MTIRLKEGSISLIRKVPRASENKEWSLKRSIGGPGLRECHRLALLASTQQQVVKAQPVARSSSTAFEFAFG